MNKTVVGILLSGGLLALVPWLGLPAFYESFLYLICHWMILALSWNILSGYSGYFSFGHGAFFGIGMYTSAGLAANLNWPFLWTLPVAALLAALFGMLLGSVVFRVKSVRGELFALLTLAVTFIVGTVVLNTRIDGGPGIYLNAVPVPALGPTPSASIFLMALAGAVITLLLAYYVHASKLGVGLFAIHDDEDVAEVLGVPTFSYKIMAFGISCALAGLAGGIHALFVSYVTAGEVFTITVPLTVVLMSVLGGTRHWAGPVVGSVVITCLMYFFTAGNNPVLGKAAVGVILVIVILFLFLGKPFLQILGLDVKSFAVGGSIVIFLLGLEMVLGHEIFKGDKNAHSGAVVPIAFPIIAGSGTLTTIMSLKANFDELYIALGILINLVIVYAVLKSLNIIEKLLGPGGLLAVRKFFGVILLAIAVKIFSSNVGALRR